MSSTPDAVWTACLEVIRDHVSEAQFKTWFAPLRAVRLEEEEDPTLTVELPSRFYHEWIEEHYYGLLRRAVSSVLGQRGRLLYDIVIEREDAESGREGTTIQVPARRPVAPEPEPPPATPPHPFAIPGLRTREPGTQLNPDYTFDRFIEGDCNQLARNASLAIAQEPGTTRFNPFLIYGGVGLGKTHLIQAVGNHALRHGKIKRVLYVSSERFTNDFVQAIQHNRANDFSRYYRQVDLLIVDDIQFFSGKEKTQEEFFHIFNSLHQHGKQIILSADRAPREIQGIEERLLSRFQWGLSADVQAPELETRMAILRRKAEEDGIDVSPEVIDFIAKNVRSNIRELEGALIRLLAHATLHKREIDIDLARTVLDDLVEQRPSVRLTVEEIQRIVAAYFDLSEDLLRARTRKREIVRARQVAMYFCKAFTQHSLKTIGLRFGGRDHSTVIHANKSVEDQLEVDEQFARIVEEVRSRIVERSG